MKIRSLLHAGVGIATELLYSLAILLAGFAVSFLFSLHR